MVQNVAHFGGLAGRAKVVMSSVLPARPYRLARPRTSPFHGGNGGSNPPGDAKSYQSLVAFPFVNCFGSVTHG